MECYKQMICHFWGLNWLEFARFYMYLQVKINIDNFVRVWKFFGEIYFCARIHSLLQVAAYFSI